MIVSEKNRGALLALNAVLVLARNLAYEGKSADLAIILDVAEYLPTLMLDLGDRTAEFRQSIVDLVQRYPTFALALERFDRST